MASNPATCPSCRATMAPGARFCGICGRSSDGAAAAMAGGVPLPPPTPVPQQGGAGNDAFESVALPVAPAHAAAALPAALVRAGAKVTEQVPGRVRFEVSKWTWGSRYVGEAAVAPAGPGSVVSVSMAIDNGRFAMWGVMCVVAALISAFASLLITLVVIACVGWEYSELTGKRKGEVRGRIVAALRDGAGAPTPSAAPFAPAPAAAPPFAPVPAPHAHAAPAAAMSPVEQIRSLAEQRDRGALSPDEFERAKAAVLARMV